MARERMREVEIVDDDDPLAGAVQETRPVDHPPGSTDAVPGGTSAPDPGGDLRAGGGSHHHRRRTRIATAVTLLAVAGVALSVDAAQERAEAARLAALPGVLAPVEPGLAERWRRPAGDIRTATPDGDLLVSARAVAGGRTVTRIDAGTGRDLWTAALPEVEETGDVACVPLVDPATGGTAQVACRLVTAGEAMVPSGGRVAAGARTALVVLDGRTGRRIGERDLGPRWTTITGLGSDVVLVQMLPDRHVRVTREHPLTGRVRWLVTSARSFVAPLPPGGEPATPVPRVDRGVVVADGTLGLAVSPDGTRLGEWVTRRSYAVDVDRLLHVVPLGNGRFAVYEPLPHEPSGTLTAAGARDRWFSGPVVEPVVDDGSAPDLVLTQPEQLVAVDATTGRFRWRAPDGVLRSDLLRLDERVIVPVAGGVVALDATTGAELWRADVPAGAVQRQMLTDGRVVLVPTRQGGDPRIVALGLRDGRERWSAPVPAGISEYLVVGGHLVAVADGDLLALG